MPCDTAAFVFPLQPPSLHDQRHLIFLKNSDRPVDEPQVVEVHPRQHHAPGTKLRVTHITIPQVSCTYAVCTSCPGHMWGAEMGVNEFGVVIGNEAIWASRVAVRKQNDALTGMDLVRLALERSRSAQEAVAVIQSLALEHPLGGNCGDAKHPLYYHNGFVIGDRSGVVITLITLGQRCILYRKQGGGEVVPHQNEAVTQEGQEVEEEVEAHDEDVIDERSGVVVLSNALPSRWRRDEVVMSDEASQVLDYWAAASSVSSPLHRLPLRSLVGFGYHALCDFFGKGCRRAHRMRLRLLTVCRKGRSVEEAVLGCFNVLRDHDDDDVDDEQEDAASNDNNCCGRVRSSTKSSWMLTMIPRPLRFIMRVVRRWSTVMNRYWLRNDICMHAGVGPIRIMSTTNSMVVAVAVQPTSSGSVPQDDATDVVDEGEGAFKGVRVWSTRSSNPCLTPFRRVSLTMPSFLPGAVEREVLVQQWWDAERLHRRWHRKTLWSSGLEWSSDRCWAVATQNFLSERLHSIEREEVAPVMDTGTTSMAKDIEATAHLRDGPLRDALTFLHDQQERRPACGGVIDRCLAIAVAVATWPYREAFVFQYTQNQ